MTIAAVNIVARTNEPFYQAFLINEDGEEMDLTGKDLRMHVRAKASSNHKVLDLTTGNGRLVIDPSSGSNLAIQIPIEVIATVPAGTYVHDLKEWGGRVIWTGSFTFVQGVTR